MKQYVALCLLISILLSYSYAYGIEKANRITDREIIEALTEIKSEIKSLNKRFDDVNKRFDDVNNRIADLNNRVNNLASIFTAIVVAIIGFAIWDRKTMTKPFEDKVKKIDDEISDNSNKLKLLLDALRNLSKTDKNVAEVLKRFNLL